MKETNEIPEKMPPSHTPFFVFDVESIGLHGEAFAVAGGVFINGACQSGFRFCCPPAEAHGTDADREWVKANVPVMEITHNNPTAIREAFWDQWDRARTFYPGICMAGECIWPVEANFVSACIRDNPEDRAWKGSYPFHDIASFMQAAGMDPLATYDRLPSELPQHDPYADACQSARLLAEALCKREVHDQAPAIEKPLEHLPDGGEWPPRSNPKEELIMTSKSFRVDLDTTLQLMKALRDELTTPGVSLEGIAADPKEVVPNLVLSIRHVEDAVMRQGMFLKAVGSPNPYPKSYDPSSPVVEPTADGLTL